MNTLPQKQLTEADVKSIVRQVIGENYTSGTPIIPPHTHDGVSNLKINQANIIPSTKFNGTIDMNQSTIYTIPITGNPTQITFYGGALNITDSPSKHAMVIGSAQFGPCYQFQPGTSTSTTLNTVKTSIIQGSGTIVVSNAGTSYLKNSQGHIIYVETATAVADGGTILAMATITSISNSAIQITTVLDTNWRISGLWTVI